jgi:hypothetical protein
MRCTTRDNAIAWITGKRLYQQLAYIFVQSVSATIWLHILLMLSVTARIRLRWVSLPRSGYCTYSPLLSVTARIRLRKISLPGSGYKFFLVLCHHQDPVTYIYVFSVTARIWLHILFSLVSLFWVSLPRSGYIFLSWVPLPGPGQIFSVTASTWTSALSMECATFKSWLDLMWCRCFSWKKIPVTMRS